MFDPTVFDNLKVVVEGDLYDLDLDGELQVVNRSDRIDLATMSRVFKMSITKNNERIGDIILSTDIENLSGELLQLKGQPGCLVDVAFHRRVDKSVNTDTLLERWKQELVAIWGEQWDISLFVTRKYGSNEHIHLTAKIRFDRLFHEDNVDDLRELLTFIVDSL